MVDTTVTNRPVKGAPAAATTAATPPGTAAVPGTATKTSSPPNAWAQKPPVIKADAASSQHQGNPGNASTPPITASATPGATAIKMQQQPNNNKAAQAVTFGTVGQASPSPQKPPVLSYAKVTKKLSPSPSVSGSLPQQVQREINAARPAAGPLHFGTLQSPSPQKPQPPVSGNPSSMMTSAAPFRGMQQFQDIQRVRSAPPELQPEPQQEPKPSSEKVQDPPAVTAKDAANGAAAQPQRMAPPPQAAPQQQPAGGYYPNPAANAFSPEYNAYMQQMQMAQMQAAYYGYRPGMYQVPYGAPPPFGYQASAPSTAASTPGQTRAIPIVTPMHPAVVAPSNSVPSLPANAVAPVIMPAPGSAVSSSAPATPAVTFKRPNAIKIVLKNPDTGKEISLPKKESAVAEKEKEVSSSAPMNASPEKPSVKPTTSVPSSPEKQIPAAVTKTPSPAKSASPLRDPSPAATKSKSPIREASPAKNASPVRAQSPAKTPAASEEKPTSKEPNKAAEEPLRGRSESPAKQPVAPAVAASPKPSPAKTKPAASPSRSRPMDQVRRYSRELLLRFSKHPIALVRNPNLLECEAVIGAESGGRPPSGMRTSGAPRNRMSDAGRMRHSDMGLPLRRQDSAPRGPRGPPPGFDRDRAPPPGRASMGGQVNRRASRNSRGGRGTEPRESPKPEIILQKSENRWVPGAQAKAAGVTDNEPLEALKRSVRSLLNKLTLEKFDSVSDKLIALPIVDLDSLLEVVQLIYDKAVEEARFADMYAKLIYKLSSQLPDFPADYVDALIAENGGDAVLFSARNQFRRRMLAKCQAEFEKKSEWSNNDKPPRHITDEMSQEEIDEFNAEESKRRKLKRRALCNISFIGGLFKLGMLSEKIIHECVKHLLRDPTNPEEEEMESVCDLLTSVGTKLDHEKAQPHVDMYFMRLKALSEHKGLSSRVRFMLKDLVELRERKWEIREQQLLMKGGPMTIEEIYKAEQEKQRQERLKEMAARDQGYRGSGGPRRFEDRPRRGGDRMSGPPDDYAGRPSAVASRRPPEKGKRVPVDTRNVVLGPSTGLGTGAKGWSTAGGKGDIRKTDSQVSEAGLKRTGRPGTEEAAPAVKTRINAFDLLAQNEDNVEEEVEVSPAGGEDVKDGRVVVFDLPKENMTSTDLEKYFSRKFSEEFVAACKESVSAALGVVLKVRSFVADGAEEDITIKALGKLLEDVSKHALKLQDAASRSIVETLGLVVVELVQNELLPLDAWLEYLQATTSTLVDTILDCPGMEVCLGVVAGACVWKNICTLAFARQCMLEMADLMGDYTPRVVKKPGFKPSPPVPAVFLATILDTVRSLSDESVMVQVWSAHVQELDQAPESPVASMRYPWWGTDEAKLADIEDDMITAWLQKRSLEGLLTVAAATGASSDSPSSNQEATKDTSVDRLGSFQKFLETAKDRASVQEYIGFKMEGGLKRDPRVVKLLTEYAIQKGHEEACKKSGGSTLQDTKQFKQFGRPVLEEYLRSLLKSLIVRSSDNKQRLTVDLAKQLQLEVLWTVQDVCNRGEFKSRDWYCCRVFELLYDLDLVDNDVFFAWEADESRLCDTKEVTMVRGVREFLRSIKDSE